MHQADERIIHLHRQAPEKPASGAPCNGCGVCCALETCPLARLRFLQITGPCPALTWRTTETRYHCGLLTRPRDFFPYLPSQLLPLLQRLCQRWISAGSGCDCSSETLGPK